MRKHNDHRPRDHGGNLDAAIQRYGGKAEQWMDLSTGINPVAYPVPPIPPAAWADLPRKGDMQRLSDAARRAYGTRAALTVLAGAQGAIQIMANLRPAGDARLLFPTYNEHEAALRRGGWEVARVSSLDGLRGADLAVVVNPNNPDGRCHDPACLRDLAGTVRLLIVDESFVDVMPHLSLAPVLHEVDNVVLLRSFGKFYGLAGIRLGFALGARTWIDPLSELAGPWPISGPAIEIALDAFANDAWHRATTERLTRDAARLDRLALQKGLALVGGTALFRTFAAPDAAEAQSTLAQHHIWSRIFAYSPTWIRLGLPATEPGWERLERALSSIDVAGRR